MDRIVERAYGDRSLPLPDIYASNRSVTILCDHRLFRHIYTLDLKDRLAYGGNLFVREEARGCGMGRALVAARENVCKELESDILIDLCENHPFWAHLGYRRMLPWEYPLYKMKRSNITLFGSRIKKVARL